MNQMKITNLKSKTRKNKKNLSDVYSMALFFTKNTGLGIRFLVFIGNCSFFVSKRATRANRSWSLFKKRDIAKIDGSNSLLGIKRRKTVKNIQKTRIFLVNRSLFVSESLESQITSKSLT